MRASTGLIVLYCAGLKKMSAPLFDETRASLLSKRPASESELFARLNTLQLEQQGVATVLRGRFQ